MHIAIRAPRWVQIGVYGTLIGESDLHKSKMYMALLHHACIGREEARTIDVDGIPSEELSARQNAEGEFDDLEGILCRQNWQYCLDLMIIMNIVVVLPAYNEAIAISKTIEDFAARLPDAQIVVVDNNSSDRTTETAKECFARLGRHNDLVLQEPRQGKSNAMRRAFAQLDADIYIMCDADFTYCTERIDEMIEMVKSGRYDMVVGDRRAGGVYEKQNTRAFHSFGNQLICTLISRLFQCKQTDILSGLRVFSKRFIKTFPVLSEGFEIETELALHAAVMRLPVCEVPVGYRNRPANSFSKLNTFQDGYRIIMRILFILRYNRPLYFFGCLGLFLGLLGVIAGSVPCVEFARTGLVTHFPLAILAVGLVLSGLLSLSNGLILDVVCRGRLEQLELSLAGITEKINKPRA